MFPERMKVHQVEQTSHPEVNPEELSPRFHGNTFGNDVSETVYAF